MPQSFSSVYLHAVFSTKDRQPWLREASLRADLHSYLGGISSNLDCSPQIVGGVADHVHILARLGRKITQADWVKELKRSSNIWIKKQNASLSGFSWQGGYGIFAVESSNLSRVHEYIVRQEEHHRTTSFKEELRTLLRDHNVEWDERYVWD